MLIGLYWRITMFETRSKDGKVLFIVFYSYQNHIYTVNSYYKDKLAISKKHTDLSFILDWIKSEVNKYNDKNPTYQRYHKLTSGDIYDNETETVINHSALMGLLTGLEDNDKKTVADAIMELRQ
jgi:hypothetical protein